MKYVVVCTLEWDANKIIENYPILKEYKYEIDYLYPNKTMARLLVEIDDLIKFVKEVKQEIIIRTDQYNDADKGFITIEIYDTWSE